MTGKERILNAIAGKKSDCRPLAIHGWGLYKFALCGILEDYKQEMAAWEMHGQELADVEIKFHEMFPVDWMHLSEGRCFDDIKQRIQAPGRANLLKAVRALDSKQAIDEFLDQIYFSSGEFFNGPKFEHVRILSEKYGDELFIALHTEAPICDIADSGGILEFDGTMIAMLEKPEMFTYLLQGMYLRQLRFVEAVNMSGAHAYIQSEAYITPDLISVDLFERLVLDVLIEFYEAVNELGILSMCYYTGDASGHIPYIKKMNFNGLLLEENKKNMVLDPAEILHELGEDRAVFGNIDSVGTLLNGRPNDVREAVERQLDNTDSPSFILCNGSPIPFGTPHENINAYIRAAREYR